MNGSVLPVIILVALFCILFFVVYRHYSRIGLVVALIWFLPGLIYLWFKLLSLDSAALAYSKIGQTAQFVAALAFILWFRRHYIVKIERKVPGAKSARIRIEGF